MDGTIERIETVIVGGGQAGLAAGYHLAARGRPFVILDANTRIGGSWRDRWDSLVLFTPARYCGLPGWRFPLPGGSFPTKDEVAAYLEGYAARFELPVRNDVRVDRVSGDGSGFVVRADDLRIEAENVIVATGANREPRVPVLADQLDPAIIQLHSSQYRGPSQLRDGGVLIVGAGNSGADIAMEIVRQHPTWLSGPSTGHVPFRIETAFARHVAIRMIRFVGLHVLTTRTPLGRKARQTFASRGGPLVRVKPKDLSAAGVARVPRTVGVRGGAPVLEDGGVVDVTNVIWCTGFRQGLSWVDLPVFGEDGEPVHDRGVAPGAAGLYFVGLPFQYAAASDVLPGVGRDAAYIVKRLVDRRSHPEPALAAGSA